MGSTEREGGRRAVDCLRKEGGVRDPEGGSGGGSHHMGAVGKNRPLEMEVTVDRRFSFAKGETAGDVYTENRKRDLVLVGNRL